MDRNEDGIRDSAGYGAPPGILDEIFLRKTQSFDHPVANDIFKLGLSRGADPLKPWGPEGGGKYLSDY